MHWIKILQTTLMITHTQPFEWDMARKVMPMETEPLPRAEIDRIADLIGVSEVKSEECWIIWRCVPLPRALMRGRCGPRIPDPIRV